MKTKTYDWAQEEYRSFLKGICIGFVMSLVLWAAVIEGIKFLVG